MDALKHAIREDVDLDLVRDLAKICDPNGPFQGTVKQAINQIQCKRRKIEVCDILMENGANYLTVTRTQLSCLKQAVWNNDLSFVQSVSSTHPHLIKPDLLCGIKNIETARLLVELGCDIHGAHELSCKVLGCCYDLEICQYFLDQGADINAVQPKGGCNLPPLFSCHEIKFEKMEWLLQHGADPNITSNCGTLMMTTRSINTVKLLLRYGADLNVQDKDGMTALHYNLKHRSNHTITKWLIEHGADVNLRNNDGHTPLYTYLAKCQVSTRLDTRLYELLVNSGAHLGGRKLSVREIWNKHGYIAIQYFLEHNVDLSLKPLDEQIINGLKNDQVEIMDEILQSITNTNTVNQYVFLTRSQQMAALLIHHNYSIKYHLCHFINYDRIEVVRYLCREIDDKWWSTNLWQVKAPSLEMCELLQPPVNIWHISSDQLKWRLSKGITDEELASRACSVAREILEVRKKRFEWWKVFIQGNGGMFNLPRHIVQRVVLFIV